MNARTYPKAEHRSQRPWRQLRVDWGASGATARRGKSRGKNCTMMVVIVRLLVRDVAAELAFWRETMGFSLAFSDERKGTSRMARRSGVDPLS